MEYDGILTAEEAQHLMNLEWDANSYSCVLRDVMIHILSAANTGAFGVIYAMPEVEPNCYKKIKKDLEGAGYDVLITDTDRPYCQGEMHISWKHAIRLET